jgi:ribosomal protein L12E/L44/L45/RPP1/RPP2
MSVPDYQNVFLKYSDIAGVTPLATELNIAELAINTADGILFAKKNDGTVLSFKDASTFALAVHGHSISDISGLQSALDTLTTAAATAQSAAEGAQSTANAAVLNAATAQNGADASLKKDQNLADLSDKAMARSNLGVMSSGETTTAIATAKGEAEVYTDGAITALVGGASDAYKTLKLIQTEIEGTDAVGGLVGTISAVSTRVSTLEGQNLDSRITTAQSAADTAQSGADASLKKSDNLAAVADKGAARTNLEVYSTTEVDVAISSAIGTLSGSASADISAVSGRVTTLEGQNLDSRLSTAETQLSGLGTMSVQNSDNVSISGGSITGSVTLGSSQALLPTDAGTVLTSRSTIRGGTFSGF